MQDDSGAPLSLRQRALRWRAREALKCYFERKRGPQFTLGLLLILTGLAGFGFSFGLLKFGMTEMWMRYPVAVALTYGVFLGLMRLWVEVERAHFNPEDPEFLALLEQPVQKPAPWSPDDGKKKWYEYLDAPSGLDGEGCLWGLLLMSVVGLFALLLAGLAAAPLLIAEVFVEVALVGLLYKRLRLATHEHWLGVAVRTTWAYALAAAILLGIMGFCLDLLAPNSDSMGQALQEIRRGK